MKKRLREELDRIIHFLLNTFVFFTFLFFILLGILGFVFGTSSLIILCLNYGIEPTNIYFLIKGLGYLCQFGIFLFIVILILWLTNKLLVPYIEKAREERKKEFESFMRKIIKEENTHKRKKNGNT